VFFHEHGASQFHRKTRGLGIDVEALLLCERWGLEIHYYQRPDGPLRTARPADFRRHGVLAAWDGRTRYFLPDGRWKKEDLTYAVPWIHRRLVLPDQLPGADPDLGLRGAGHGLSPEVHPPTGAGPRQLPLLLPDG
jgi:hypothetical protein